MFIIYNAFYSIDLFFSTTLYKSIWIAPISISIKPTIVEFCLKYMQYHVSWHSQLHINMGGWVMNRHFCRHIGLYNLLSKISKLHAIIEYHDVAFIQTCLCVAAGYASKKSYLNWWSEPASSMFYARTILISYMHGSYQFHN